MYNIEPIYVVSISDNINIRRESWQFSKEGEYEQLEIQRLLRGEYSFFSHIHPPFSCVFSICSCTMYICTYVHNISLALLGLLAFLWSLSLSSYASACLFLIMKKKLHNCNFLVLVITIIKANGVEPFDRFCQYTNKKSTLVLVMHGVYLYLHIQYTMGDFS